MAISKRVRFEVFKRDSFTCQYCGAQAPNVLLECDHIQPQSKDGEDDITNLVTACESCNSGKSNILLSDDTAMARKKAQLDKLQERREQLELMFEWHKELLVLDSEMVDKVCDVFADEAGFVRIAINESSRSTLLRHIKNFGLSEVLASVSEVIRAYGEPREDGDGITQSSAEFALTKIGAVCSVRRQMIAEPYLKALYYIRGILRNRVGHNAGYSDQRCIIDLRRAARKVPAEVIQDLAQRTNSWREFCSDLLFMEKDYGPGKRR